MRNLVRKSEVRACHKRKRENLETFQVKEYSRGICQSLSEHILQIPDLQQRGVLAYYPLGNEVTLLPLYQQLFSDNVPLSFPKVKGDHIFFYQIQSLGELAKGCFGVMEPEGTGEPSVWKKAVCLVPGVAFDERGGRYGYGKGYYDRFLRKHPDIRKIGIAYESQIEPVLVTDDTDIYMNEIVTENRWIHCHERSYDYGTDTNLHQC